MTNVLTKLDSVLLTALRTAIIVQVLSLSLSIALSSIAFALAVILYLYFFFKHRELVYRPFGLEKYFLAYIIAVILMCLFAWYPADAWSNSRRVLLIAGVFFIPVICTNEKSIVRYLLTLKLLCSGPLMGTSIVLKTKSLSSTISDSFTKGLRKMKSYCIHDRGMLLYSCPLFSLFTTECIIVKMKYELIRCSGASLTNDD